MIFLILFVKIVCFKIVFKNVKFNLKHHNLSQKVYGFDNQTFNTCKAQKNRLKMNEYTIYQMICWSIFLNPKKNYDLKFFLWSKNELSIFSSQNILLEWMIQKVLQQRYLWLKLYIILLIEKNEQLKFTPKIENKKIKQKNYPNTIW